MNTRASLLEMQQQRARVVDYLLHGIVGIRLVNPSPPDVAAVTRQLGPIQRPLTRDPDVTVRFVRGLDRPPRLTRVGLNDAGFSDESFFVFGRRGRARIDFTQIGDHVEIVCESTNGPVPLLIPVINLAALARGVVAVHASAFLYRGKGVVVAGWAKGGKTESLLAFMANGAKYVGDEWIYIHPAEKRVFGIPEPMRIWDWHLTHGADIRRPLPFRTRSRFRAIKAVGALDRGAPRSLRGAPGRSLLTRAASLLERQLWIQIPPEEMFGRTSCAYEGSFDQLFLAVSHDSSATEIEEARAGDLAARIAFSTQHERLDFLSYYLKFRFAFPDARNDFLESAAALETELLAQATADVPAWIVRHPFPASIPSLFEAMDPIVSAG